MSSWRASCTEVFSLCMPNFILSSTRRHTIYGRDWSSDVCSSDLLVVVVSGDEVRLQVRSQREISMPQPVHAGDEDRLLRSEERRVGKECRSRWSLYR